MDLFDQNTNSNILPYDGKAYYYGPVFSLEKATYYFNQLIEEVEWKNDQLIIFGKLITTKRKVAWYGDKPYRYNYSNTSKFALDWTQGLFELKTMIEKISGETYNSCLLNLYHSGDEGMAWHSDNEPELKKQGAIASLSLGAERRFVFKHKASKQTQQVLLEQGSLLVMKDETQDFWLHRLPPTKKIKSPRINLTFRTIVA